MARRKNEVPGLYHSGGYLHSQSVRDTRLSPKHAPKIRVKSRVGVTGGHVAGATPGEATHTPKTATARSIRKANHMAKKESIAKVRTHPTESLGVHPPQVHQPKPKIPKGTSTRKARRMRKI